MSLANASQQLVQLAAAVWANGARHAARTSSRRLGQPLAQSRRECAVPTGNRDLAASDWSAVDAAIERLARFRLAGVFEQQRRPLLHAALLSRGIRRATAGQRAAGRDRPGHGRRTRRISFEGRRAAGHISSRSIGRGAWPACSWAACTAAASQPRPRSAGRNARRRLARQSSRLSCTRVSDVTTPDEDIAAGLRLAKCRLHDRHEFRNRPQPREHVRRRFCKTRLAAISPLTADVLAELGYPADDYCGNLHERRCCEAILAAVSDHVCKLRETLPTRGASNYTGRNVRRLHEFSRHVRCNLIAASLSAKRLTFDAAVTQRPMLSVGQALA